MSAKRVAAWLVLVLVVCVGRDAKAADTRLVDAVKHGDRAAVRALLQKKADLNAPEADGMTALHWAVQQDDVETATILLRAGANATATNRYGVTPLLLAALNGNAAVIAALLEAGADVNAASPEGETPLMAAARNGKVDALRLLLQRGAEVNKKETWRGQSALMWAAGEGHAPAVRALIEAGGDLNARSTGGFTPLLFAVREGQLDATRDLIKAGGNPNDKVEARSAQPKMPPPGGTNAPGVRRIAGGDDAPTSALGMAIINGYYELAAALLEAGANANVPDPRGSALLAVAYVRSPGIGAGGGSPPSQRGSVDSLTLAKALLEHGANPNARITWKEIEFDRDNAQTKTAPNIPSGRTYLTFIGATPFFIAAKGGDVELMQLLVAHSADPKLPTIQGVTPLMVAAGLGYWDGESPGPLTGVPEARAVEAVKLALELGNDVNAVTSFGGPKLEGDPGILLRRHPLNLPTYNGPHDAPLDIVPPVEALGDMRWNGSSALHGAATRGSNAIVQLLVDHGARLDAKNTLGWTPLMCAEGVFVANTEKDWPETVVLLRTLMQEHGLNPDLYGQASIGLKTSRDISRSNR